MKKIIIWLLISSCLATPIMANAAVANAHQKLVQRQGLAVKNPHITPKNALLTASAFATMVMTLLYLGQKSETLSIHDQEIKARTDLYRSLARVCDSLHKCN